MKKVLYSLLVIVIAFALLQKYVVATRFNLFNNNILTFSETKEESIKRGVFVCDVKFSPDSKWDGKPLMLNVEEGWIEKSWSTGFWYWTTLEYDDSYTIMMKSPGNQELKSKLVIKNDKDTGWGKEKMWYRNGVFKGLILMPESDTIKFFLLKENNTNFSPSNIAGELKIALER